MLESFGSEKASIARAGGRLSSKKSGGLPSFQRLRVWGFRVSGLGLRPLGFRLVFADLLGVY